MTATPDVHPAEPPATYEGDYYGWLVQQAELLDAGGNAHADWKNIAEALRDLGNEQVHRLESAFRVLLMHLLKWDFQPGRRSRSWYLSIHTSRNRIARQLRKSGSLRRASAEACADAYEDARLEAAKETRLAEETFPIECPYSFDEMMTRDIPWPPRH